MSVKNQIKEYLAGLPEAKRADMDLLHKTILDLNPSGKLWFLDGKDENKKTVTNPNIGYGEYTIQYADGKTKKFYQVGLSANTSGISVYIMGLPDKHYLSKTYGEKIGKASVSGYCIKFKAVKDVEVDVLKEAIVDRFGR